MKRVSLFLLLFAVAVSPIRIAAQAAGAAKQAPAAAAKAAAPAAAGAARVIDIDATDAMKFSVTTINAKPGELLKVRLKGAGTMPKAAMSHNFVLLKSTAKADTFVADALMVGPAGNYIPPAHKADIIANTPTLVGPGETSEVSFKAPAAGTYTFLCSYPGHFAAGMKGTLVVK